VAFLRGINVGGHNTIKMVDLAAAFEIAGFPNSKTHIQSGNVLFECEDLDSQLIVAQIQRQMARSFGKEIPVMVRTYSEMSTLVTAFPFKDIGTENKFYVAFLSAPPNPDLAAALTSISDTDETYMIRGRELVVAIRKIPTKKIVFSNNFIEKKLKILGTTRNWNVVTKVFHLLKTMA
jgi:uncharacterized protein (DUF1697 family)